MKDYKIIPSILEKNPDEIKNKIKLLKDFTNDFQIDISDGIFDRNLTILESGSLEDVFKNSHIEVHLMVKNPHKHCENWTKAGAKEIIFHLESFIDLPKKQREFGINNLINIIKKQNIKVTLGILYQTDFIFLEPFINNIDSVLFMSIKDVGYQGQTLEEGIYDKIYNFRQIFQDIGLQIDGGINDKNIIDLKNAGANIFVVGSYIWKGDTQKNFKTLDSILNE